MIQQFVKMQVWLATRKPTKGQSLAEYGLILALVAVLCITALQLLGGTIQSMLNNLSSAIQGASSGS